MLRSPTRRWWRKRQIWWIWLIRFALERFIAFEHPCRNALDDSIVRGWEIERDYASMQYVTNWRRFRYHQFHRQVASAVAYGAFFFFASAFIQFLLPRATPGRRFYWNFSGRTAWGVRELSVSVHNFRDAAAMWWWNASEHSVEYGAEKWLGADVPRIELIKSAS